jgi:hypothetical protein
LRAFLYERLFLVAFKLEKDVRTKKARKKTLVKLTPGVDCTAFSKKLLFNFANFLLNTLTKFAKSLCWICKLKYVRRLPNLCNVCAKSCIACKMFVKLTPGVDQAKLSDCF